MLLVVGRPHDSGHDFYDTHDLLLTFFSLLYPQRKGHIGPFVTLLMHYNIKPELY